MSNLRKKKILFLITKSNWGGAQRYVFDLANTLDAERYEITVALGGTGKLLEQLTDIGIRTIVIPGLERNISLRKEIWATFSIARIIRREKPDVLHVNSSKAGAFGTFLGRILQVPTIIFTAHGWAFNEGRPPWQLFLIKSIHWLTVIFSHKTIAVSTSIKSQMDWIGTQKKITVINPGRTLTELKSKNEARGILETKITNNTGNLFEYHKDIWVGTIAELHPIKQIHVAIDVMAQLVKVLPNTRYIIIGSGQCQEELHQQVHRLDLEQHVFFTGAIHEASHFLRAFDVFMLPSLSEAYGYVLVEAGLAHVPVIATNVGGIPDIITHNKTGLLVPSGDASALADALHTLLSDKNLQRQISAALFSQLQHNTVEKMARETARLYER